MSSFFKRSPPHPDYDDDNDSSIDPELRLRTVRTAASAIAESIQTERRVERRKTRRKNASRFFRRGDKKAPSIAASSDSRAPSAKAHHGPRRNIYVNYPLSAAEVDSRGEPMTRYSRNKVRTSSE
jgi:phospholipid-translocating ATPase